MLAARAWAAWWCVCLLLWLGLTTTFDPAELAAGAIASAIAATAAQLVGRTGPMRFQPRWAWIARGHRVVGAVAIDTVVLLRAVIAHLAGKREIRGAFRVVPLRPGGDDPRSSARRALLTLAISATPNTYVVGIDQDREVMLVHQLVPAPKDGVAHDVLGRL